MTTSITTPNNAPAVRKPEVTKGGALSALVPDSIDSAFRLATALSQAGDMVPQAFRGKPEMTMAAIVRGMEVGLAPMQALSSIVVIQGRATLWGDAIPALVQRAGHHIDVDFEGQGDDLTAVATLTRGDTGKKVVRRFSLSDAKRAGLLGKPGPWQQYPQRMIMHRARSWAVRDGAADALMGMQVTEEVQDYGPDTARNVTPDRPPRRASRISFVPAAADPVNEPDTDEVDEILEADASAGDQGMWLHLADMIRERLSDGATPADLREAFAGEIAQMEVAAPDLHAKLQGELEAYRAQEAGA